MTLEVTVLVMQYFFLRTSLKKRPIKKFLAVNGSMIYLNLVLAFRTQFSHSEGIYLACFYLGILILILSTVYYLDGVPYKKSSLRSVIMVIAVSLFLTILVLCIQIFHGFPAEFGLLGAILSFLTIIAVIGLPVLKQMTNRFWTFATAVTLVHIITFTLYLSQSSISLIIFLNILFIMLFVFHHIMLLRAINVVAHGHKVEVPTNLSAALAKFNLTERQQEIAELYLVGLEPKKIAGICHITSGAVRTHLTNLRRTIGVEDNEALRTRFRNYL